MNSVGIDISKGRKHDCRHAPLWRGHHLATAEVRHTDSELSEAG